MLFFKCIKERYEYAKDRIKDYLCDDSGWREEVTGIVTGTITHMVCQTRVEERPPEDEIDEEGCDGNGSYWGEFDYRCDYALNNMERIKDDAMEDEDTLSY